MAFAGSLTGAKLICLGDYSNSRGASEMGLYPDLLPGYEPIAANKKIQRRMGDLPSEKGLALPEMMDAAKAGKLKALYVVGSNPVGRLDIDPFTFSKSFVVVQDMFLTETANHRGRGLYPRRTLMRRAGHTQILAVICNWSKRLGRSPTRSPISR